MCQEADSPVDQEFMIIKSLAEVLMSIVFQKIVHKGHQIAINTNITPAFFQNTMVFFW